eukprot:scaffold1334_cov344-Prasinococcus_capsulatus_cf.AAC.15
MRRQQELERVIGIHRVDSAAAYLKLACVQLNLAFNDIRDLTPLESLQCLEVGRCSTDRATPHATRGQCTTCQCALSAAGGERDAQPSGASAELGAAASAARPQGLPQPHQLPPRPRRVRAVARALAQQQPGATRPRLLWEMGASRRPTAVVAHRAGARRGAVRALGGAAAAGASRGKLQPLLPRAAWRSGRTPCKPHAPCHPRTREPRPRGAQLQARDPPHNACVSDGGHGVRGRCWTPPPSPTRSAAPRRRALLTPSQVRMASRPRRRRPGLRRTSCSGSDRRRRRRSMAPKAMALSTATRLRQQHQQPHTHDDGCSRPPDARHRRSGLRRAALACGTPAARQARLSTSSSGGPGRRARRAPRTAARPPR